jgi:hypothetical protein
VKTAVLPAVADELATMVIVALLAPAGIVIEAGMSPRSRR